MRSYDSATAAYMAARSPIHAHALVWVAARNRETGLSETIGFWTGDDHRDFVVAGSTRTYYGAGAALGVDPIRRGTGLQVRTQRLSLSGIAPEVQLAVRGYDVRHAVIEIHRAVFDPLTLALVAPPHRLFKGYIDKLRFQTGAKGEASSVDLDVASGARALATPLSRKRSDASLRARMPADAFRQYASQADAVETRWGSA
ncbi:hypothetical protein [Ruixingdingia sedimenti]|uniref:Uncharacterized protein n=1 Tax=Ruixingdingia sedimenti TaxID=3073604 RepID=A0ABU1FG52_9RHOB|nr:hypothetical protein [Xinfangfangia sp. LG-4]MDR5655367.1 hypothetical protein [Xinfangfangia sp. LG-4]